MNAPSPAPLPLLTGATAQALELPSLLAVVARLAATDLGRSRVLELLPLTDEMALRTHRERFEETARLLPSGPLVPDFEHPLAALLDRLVTGRPPIEGIDLVRLADLCRASLAVAERVRAADPPCPGLARWTGGLPDLDPLLRHIARRLDRRGEVREDASPRLAALRQRIRRTRDVIYRELSGFVAEHRDDLSEETIPMRGGRLVVMQQAGARGRATGLVHGRSATGKSFYFEPLQVVEANNTLQQSVEDEEEERRRILAELIAEARTALPLLREHAALLGEVDLVQAAVRFGDRCGGRLPEIAGRHELRLVAARHPLLDPHLADLRADALGQAGHRGEVVPLDLELGGGRRVLVVTGPNAGGKTVALKTAGLLALAAQCGLPIPAAAGSRMPFFTRVVATVGDEQDLLADRSTFSGRLLRLKEAWEEAGSDSLVLLDELGSGTDPEEGSALAASLLEGLVEKGTLGVITTHLAQLAAVALELPGATCAAMEFAPETGRPTFRLIPGPPGGSEALALARRLGLPGEWLDRAEARLGPEHRDLRRLLAEVERVRQEVTVLRERLTVEEEDAVKLRRRLAAELAALAGERAEVGRRSRAELEAFRREVTGRLRSELGRLEEQLAAGRRRGLVPEAVERLFAGAPAEAAAGEEAAGPLVVGQPVRHRGLGWQGVLERLEDGRAEVLVHGKRVRCRPDQLSALAGREEEAGSRAAKPAGASSAAAWGGARRQAGDLEEAAGTKGTGAELNLIGQRVEGALEELDGYLDQALLASRREVRVIHGHGTGRLRQAVRSHLRTHPAVAGLREGAPNEGGNGATVVTLRGGHQ